MDRPMVFGLAGTLALLIWVMLAGAGWEATVFWRTPSVIWVFGGAALATVMAFPLDGWGAVKAVVRNALFVRHSRPEELVAVLVALAHTARRDGLLALERPVGAMRDEYVKRPLRMVIDGTDPAVIAKIVRAELEAVDLRHTYGVRMMESAARSAPVFGMMGTLIGLVLMLGRMNDPAAIGPGMAVALLTTLYGLVLAHVFCLPMARRLAHRSSEELLLRTVALEGVLAIQAGDNPRIVEQKLQAYVPSSTWTDAAESLLTGVAQSKDARHRDETRVGQRPTVANKGSDGTQSIGGGDAQEPGRAGTDAMSALTVDALETWLAQRRQADTKEPDRRLSKKPALARPSMAREVV